jgi:hypothetical protein
MNIRKYKPKSYSLETSLDSNFLHAEKLLKSTKETVERSKKAMKEAKRLVRERKQA